MTKKAIYILFVILAIVIGLYPLLYFFIDKKFGLLSTKTNQLLANTFWNIGFYAHIILGGLALLIGWTQFSLKIRNQNLTLHKQIGKIYVLSVLVSAPAGIYIGFFATGGILASAGFVCLGIVWFYTTLMAYINIKNKQIAQHQKMMIYSYAACFAAVTLRLWLPLLSMVLINFTTAYIITAWLCWVPNLLVAHLITRQKNL
jgi:hypothetical protein